MSSRITAKNPSHSETIAVAETTSKTDFPNAAPTYADTFPISTRTTGSAKVGSGRQNCA
jgi:hypothetical protein